MLSVPTFLSAILLIYFFAVELRWLPATGYVPFAEDPAANLRFMVLPALTLALAEWPGIMRILRSDMIATLQEDYIALAKAKGLKPARILFVHALKPSSLTLVTITGINIGRLIGGAVIVETVFALPGIGRLLVGAIGYPRPHHPAGRGASGRRRLCHHELHCRSALRCPRSQDPSWPRLNSRLDEGSRHGTAKARTQAGTAVLDGDRLAGASCSRSRSSPISFRYRARPIWTCWNGAHRSPRSIGLEPMGSAATNFPG